MKRISLKNIDWQSLYMPLIYSTFIIYLVLLIWVVIFKSTIPEIFIYDYIRKPISYRFERGIVPFSHSYYQYVSLDMILNVIAFMPLGFYLPFMVKKRYAFPIVALVSMLFETIQLLTGFGWFDIVDLMVNVLGGFLGIGIYALLRPKLKDEIINKANAVFTIVFGIVALGVIIYLPIYFILGEPFDYVSRYY